MPEAGQKYLLDIPEQGAASASPAKHWETSFLSGNGVMGAMVMGNPAEGKLIANHYRLFLPLGSNEVVPHLAPHLDGFRQVIRDKWYNHAIFYAMEQVKETGHDTLIFTDPYHPGFELNVKVDGAAEYSEFLRTEDFTTGEVTEAWESPAGVYQRQVFVSRTDNVIVMRLRGLDGSAVSCDLEIPQLPENQHVRAYQLNHKGAPKEASSVNSLIHLETTVDAEWIGLHNDYRESDGGYDAGIRIVAPGGDAKLMEGRIRIEGAKEVLLLMRIEPWVCKGDSSQTALKAELDQLPSDYDALLEPHAAAHGALFDRVSLDLNGSAPEAALSTEELLAQAHESQQMSTELLERMYNGSRYVILCSSGPHPPNLQGIWTGTWQPAWSADYTLDTNLQLAVAHQLSANTPELLHGLFNLMDEFIDDWRLNASQLYGARGIMAPIRESNNGKSLHWSERFQGGLYWTAGAGWFAHWFYDYYLYTGDRGFLENRAVPFMQEVVAFYEDFLFKDEAGKYYFQPSYSPETHAGDNSTMDISVLKEVLSNLITAGEALEMESGQIAKWQRMRADLPDYLVNAEGELQEWILPGEKQKNDHRHMSHLYGLFQSYEFDPEGTPELWAAAEQAYLGRLNTWFRDPEHSRKGNWRETASHGRMHLGLCAARLGRGEDIWEILNSMACNGTVYSSMATAHYEGGKVFNVDANGGIPEILHNALLFSQAGRVDLLPALPAALSTGRIEGLLARGQIQVESLEWLPGVIKVKLLSAVDQSIEVRVPKADQILGFALLEGAARIAPLQGGSRSLALSAGQAATLLIEYR